MDTSSRSPICRPSAPSSPIRRPLRPSSPLSPTVRPATPTAAPVPRRPSPSRSSPWDWGDRCTGSCSHECCDPGHARGGQSFPPRASGHSEKPPLPSKNQGKKQKQSSALGIHPVHRNPSMLSRELERRNEERGKEKKDPGGSEGGVVGMYVIRRWASRQAGGEGREGGREGGVSEECVRMAIRTPAGSG